MHIQGNETKWGTVKWIHLNDIDFHDLSMFRKFNNLQGSPLPVSFFPRYPTALKSEDLPKSFMSTYFMNIIEDSRNYSGLDGIVLGNMARILNFSPVITTPNGSDFGYRLLNGTFIGRAVVLTHILIISFLFTKPISSALSWYRFNRRRSIPTNICFI